MKIAAVPETFLERLAALAGMAPTPVVDTFHAVIKQARLDEISCTDVPANPRCLVTHRYPVSPRVEYFDLMLKRVACVQQLVSLANRRLPR